MSSLKTKKPPVPVTHEQKKQILDLYNDPSSGFTKNPNHYYGLLNGSIPKSKIKFVLDNMQIYQRKQLNTPNAANKIPITQTANSYQADVTFFDKFSKKNSGYRAILCVVNINTRFAYCYPLKTKTVSEVVAALQLFLSKVKTVSVFETDEGNEFCGKIAERFYKDNGIQHYNFRKETSPNGIAIVERFNRTLRERLTNFFESSGTFRWVDVLSKIVSAYNNTMHSGIETKPVIAASKEEELAARNYGKIVQQLDNIHTTYVVGDHVRLFKKKKTAWDKGQTQYSKSVYIIQSIDNTRYTVKNIANGKVRVVLPNQMLVDISQLSQPVKRPPTRRAAADKKLVKEHGLERKQKRFLKKEGLLD